ncbi:MAG: hypothetical protein KF834_11910 [Burkholderiales bacterium]|nr:hypothetical protein [Burkholderiales bacterium]
MHTGIRLLLCALLLSFSAGCSMVRLGYGQLDTLAGWRAQDYFDLDPAQRDSFNQRFVRLHAWHRQEQLPDYARFLVETRSRAERGLRAEDILWLIDGIKARYGVIAARAAPDATELLAGLTPAQIEHLKRELAQGNRKFLRENRSNESAENRRMVQNRRTLSQLRDWVGTLSAEQEQRITELLREVPLTDRLRHEDRLRRQQEFLALLETRGGDRKAFTARMRNWLVNWEQGRPPALAKAFEDSWRKRAEFHAAVDALLTPAQRAHLLRRLQNYSEDFIALAGEGQAVARSGQSDCAKIAAC